jgi:hypothetical protein
MPPQLNRKELLLMTSLLAIGFSAGCTDGIFYKMKSMNPYFRKQWKQDQEIATSFTDRVEEMLYLQGQLPSYDSAKQQQWAEVLSGIIKNDPSPEARTLAVQTICLVPGEITVRALNIASTDDVEKVRLAACQSWKTIGGPAARDMLLTLASNQQETPSVRRAAIANLSLFDESEVRNTLARFLDDKSPAIQYQTALTLKQLTGRDYGGDLQAWRDYMSGQDVPQPDSSLMTKFWETLNWNR